MRHEREGQTLPLFIIQMSQRANRNPLPFEEAIVDRAQSSGIVAKCRPIGLLPVPTYDGW